MKFITFLILLSSFYSCFYWTQTIFSFSLASCSDIILLCFFCLACSNCFPDSYLTYISLNFLPFTTYCCFFYFSIVFYCIWENLYISQPSEKRQFNKMLWADHKIVTKGNRIFKVRTDSQISLFSNRISLDGTTKGLSNPNL